MRRSRLREGLERLVRGVGKLLRAGPRGWWLLVRVQGALLRARRDLERRPLGALLPEIRDRQGTPPSPHAVPPDPAVEARVEAVGLAVDRVARAGLTRPLCLERSLAYHRLLQGEGIEGAGIRVGVRKMKEGFEAHAWVEWEGRIVGEDPSYPARFLPLSLDQLPDLAGTAPGGVHWSSTPSRKAIS